MLRRYDRRQVYAATGDKIFSARISARVAGLHFAASSARRVAAATTMFILSRDAGYAYALLIDYLRDAITYHSRMPSTHFVVTICLID